MINFLKVAVKKILKLFNLRIIRISEAKSANQFKIIDEFADLDGNRHGILEGYKNHIWPTDWDTMNQNRKDFKVESIYELVKDGRRCVSDCKKFLAIYGLNLAQKKVLDVGCFSGASTYALAECGALGVDGIDAPENFADLFARETNEKSINEQALYLADLRAVVAQNFPVNIRKNVNFYNLDVKNLDKKNYYDFIVSWSVLEHIIDPEKAFQAMYAALRPNGICFHAYHPFFCASGAHFDTLDFPWGHIRLSAMDFNRYVEKYRPREYEIAKKRFFNSINRMTLNQLVQFSQSAGF